MRGVVAICVLPGWNLLNARYRWRSVLMGDAIAEPTGIDPVQDRRGTRKNTSATLVPGLTARARVECHAGGSTFRHKRRSTVTSEAPYSFSSLRESMLCVRP